MQTIRGISRLALLLAIAFAAAPSLSAETAPASSGDAKRFPVAGHGVLELQIPAGWHEAVEPPNDSMPTIVVVRAPSGEELLISAFTPDARRQADIADPSRVRSMVEQDGRKLLPTAVETELVLHELRGSSHLGYFYSVTDKSLVGKTPPKGEFHVLTQGWIGVGSFGLLFTVLSNEKTSPTRDTALQILATARQAIDLDSLAAEVTRSRTAPAPEKPGRQGPTPDLGALVGLSADRLRAALGEPDDCSGRSGDHCASSGTWQYTLDRSPPGWLGGGGRVLVVELGPGARCTAARWQFAR